MWVAVELATLTTVLMVGIYRTQKRWRLRGIFHLGSVGIALALFGTILGLHGGATGDRRGADAMVWTTLIKNAALQPETSERRIRLSAARLWHQGRLAPLHAWLPDAHAEGPTPISACCRGSCSTSHSTRCCASRCCSR